MIELEETEELRYLDADLLLVLQRLADKHQRQKEAEEGE